MIDSHMALVQSILPLILIASTALEVQACVCYIGQEPYHPSERYGWSLAEKKPCECTEFRLGGVNMKPQIKPYEVTIGDDPLVSINKQGEISLSLDCSDACLEEPLGMENGDIPDDSITASSEFGVYDASRARLNLQGVELAGWCSIWEDTEAWIQVSFDAKVYITALVTQGLDDPNHVDRVLTYRVAYEIGQSWNDVTDAGGLPVEFVGNIEDAITPVTNEFVEGFYAISVRIYPTNCYKEEQRYLCCMRFEVIGCK